MIKRIGLANFKCYREETAVSLAQERAIIKITFTKPPGLNIIALSIPKHAAPMFFYYSPTNTGQWMNLKTGEYVLIWDQLKSNSISIGFLYNSALVFPLEDD